MKKQMSFAFAIMSFISIFSLFDIIGIFSSVINLFENFSFKNALVMLTTIIIRLAPVAIAVLLYCNRKQDVESIMSLVLIVCGCAYLLNVLLKFSLLIQQVSLIATSSWFYSIVPLINNLASIVFGLLFIFAAINIKQGDTSGAVQGLAFIGIFMGIFMLLASMLPYSIPGTDFFSSLQIILLALGLWCLPKTIYNYEYCFFFGGNALKLLGILAAVVIFIFIFTSNEVGTGNSSRGNCFNCNGSGWDRENHCECVWCGGDGNAVWNP